MSKALEKRGETALAPRSAEELPAPIVAIALSNESYWQRMRRVVDWQMEEYLKRDFLYSAVAAVFIGALGLVWEGSVSLTAVYWGVIGFTAVFVARFGQHVFETPKLIDGATRNALNASEERTAELTKYRVVFVIDEALTSFHIHTESPTVIRITAYIGLFFVSKDQHPWSIKHIDATAHRLQVGGSVKIYAYTYIRYSHASNHQSITTDAFERMSIQPGTKTETYIVTAEISLGDEIKKPDDLGNLCFLRLTMDATGNQPPLDADMFFSWQDALSVNGARPTFIVGADTVNKITDTRLR